MVSVFLFALIFSLLAALFGRLIEGKRAADNARKGYDKAQFSINLLAKTFRTSIVISPTSPSSVSEIHVFDLSQDRCFSYRFDTNQNKLLVSENTTATTLETCRTASFSSYKDMVGVSLTGSFYVVPTTPSRAGLVVMNFYICPPSGCASSSEELHIQTTVSLRNYK